LEKGEQNKEGTVNVTLDHSPELSCSTTELCSNPDKPKSLHKALSGEDAPKWKVAIANKIINFLKQDAWEKVPMSQVQAKGHRPIPMKTVFKIKH